MTEIFIADIGKLNIDEIYHRLPAHRREKVDRCNLKRDKLLSAGAWLLLESVVGKDIEIRVSDNGKPYIMNKPDVFFNLSHSGNKVMCAVSDGEVGCDVEREDRVNLKIAERYFSRAEIDFINQNGNKEDAFLKLWTLKESFVKTVGLGMRLPFNKFTVNPGKSISVKQNCFPDKKFYFKQFYIQGHYFACCAENDGFCLESRDFS